MLRLFTLKRLLIASLALICASQAAAKSASGSNVLVLLNEANEHSEFSQFFGGLQDRGFTLTYETPRANADRLRLIDLGKRRFDHVLLFADQAKKLPTELNAHRLINFVNEGGNVLLAAGSTLPESVRNFATQFGVFFEERGSHVIDHFGFEHTLDTGRHTVLATTERATKPASLAHLFGGEPTAAPVLYQGIGHVSSANPMLSRVLSAGPTAYSAETVDSQVVDEEPAATGHELGLVSVFQARNNARVTFSGSRALFSDKYFATPVKYGADKSTKEFPQSGNKEFAERIAKWTLQEAGVLRVIGTHHERADAATVKRDGGYRVKDNVTFSIEIAEFDGQDWKPYNADDVQLEVIMLDPYVRTTLSQEAPRKDATSSVFSTTFQLPDTFGVFTFRVRYNRPGYSWIDDAREVPVRPFRHDEFPRFLSVAYPYYTGASSVMVGFAVFSFVWLYHRDPATPAKRK